MMNWFGRGHSHHHVHVHIEPSSENRAHSEKVTVALEEILERIKMIDPQIQTLMTQARASRDVLASMDTAFKAMVQQVAALQKTVADLQAGAVLTDDDRQQVKTLTDDLAAMVSTAQADITANTGQQTPGQAAQGVNDPTVNQNPGGAPGSGGTTDTGAGGGATTGGAGGGATTGTTVGGDPAAGGATATGDGTTQQ